MYPALRRHGLALAVLLLLCPELLGQTAAPPPYSRGWEKGDRWKVEVEVFARPAFGGKPASPPVKGKRPEPKHRFILSFHIQGVEEFLGKPAWRVELIPSAGAPPELSGAWALLIWRDEGWPCRLTRGDEILGTLFRFVGQTPVLTGAPTGLPIELFPLADKQELKSPDSSVSVTARRRGLDPVEVQEGFVLQGQQFEVAVKSVGYKGEKWWREYERHYKGTLDLRAKLLPESVAAIKSRPPEKTIQAPRRPDDLRTDPRLQVKLSGNFKKPTVPAVLALVQNASGVSLSCDMGDDAEKPAFMSLSLNKSPAWVVMERLAKSEIVAGRWEPTETGYRLVRTVGPPPTNPVFVVVLWLGAGIAGLSCLLLARWYFRHRAKQKPS
ncbi:MAG TPA: hypothetical protein VEL76_01465 [Gemmataceae bacterium]|nr:hypothetical protein [Gemmataceae bacterium]